MDQPSLTPSHTYATLHDARVDEGGGGGKWASDCRDDVGGGDDDDNDWLKYCSNTAPSIAKQLG